MVARRRSASTTDTTDDVSYQLGQISGQLREIVHSLVNVQSTQSAMGLRLASLEASENRREGANGLMKMILKSPAIAWLAMLAATVWAALTGRLHP
jgi:hypothetical protein